MPGPPFRQAEDEDRRMPIEGRSLGELPDTTGCIGADSVSRARILAEGILFGLLAIALTWPLAAHFRTPPPAATAGTEPPSFSRRQ